MLLKNIIIFVLGMSLSFAGILGVLGVFSSKPQMKKQSAQLRVIHSPPPISHRGDTASSHKATTDRVESAISKEIDDGAHSFDSPPMAESVKGQIESLSKSLSLPSRHLDDVEASFQQQIVALKKSRNLMLDDLALELGKMTPENAAAEIDVLDTETAKLTLSRLTTGQRRAIQRVLDAKWATLDKGARTMAARRR